jgi:hypothetical protein
MAALIATATLVSAATDVVLAGAVTGNRMPDFDQWTLTGGATFAAGVLTLPLNAQSLSPLVPISDWASWCATFEFFDATQSGYAPWQPNAGEFGESFYYAADGVTSAINSAGYGSNGHANQYPLGAWSPRSLTADAYYGGPNVQFIRYILMNSPSYAGGTLLVRNPMMTDGSLGIPTSFTPYRTLQPITATAAVTATPAATELAAAALTAAASIAVSSQPTALAAASLTAHALTVAAGAVVEPAAVSLTAAAALTATGNAVDVITGAAGPVSAAASITGPATVTAYAAATLPATATFVAFGVSSSAAQYGTNGAASTASRLAAAAVSVTVLPAAATAQPMPAAA